MAFDKKLLDILACPVCKGKLLYQNKQAQLICKFDRLVYPIRENIPVLLETEAKQLSSDDLELLLKND
ncbi:MAG: Trm112 family protein [Paraglaciecola sp.]|uniref:Trm112 family protein n=1 Tax=Paraglaciecola sp. TaxID=1920173 RepID=UPI003299D399